MDWLTPGEGHCRFPITLTGKQIWKEEVTFPRSHSGTTHRQPGTRIRVPCFAGGHGEARRSTGGQKLGEVGLGLIPSHGLEQVWHLSQAGSSVSGAVVLLPVVIPNRWYHFILTPLT